MEQETNLPTERLPQPKGLSDPSQPGAITNSSDALTLRPCGAKTGNQLLASCLTLVAPTGMSGAERQTWLAVARDALKGIPADLLERGCLAAKRTADHPAKVVPAIIKEIGKAWEDRKRFHAQRLRDEAIRNTPRLPAPEAVPHEVTQAILREVGMKLKVGGETE